MTLRVSCGPRTLLYSMVSICIFTSFQLHALTNLCMPTPKQITTSPAGIYPESVSLRSRSNPLLSCNPVEGVHVVPLSRCHFVFPGSCFVSSLMFSDRCNFTTSLGLCLVSRSCDVRRVDSAPWGCSLVQVQTLYVLYPATAPCRRTMYLVVLCFS